MVAAEVMPYQSEFAQLRELGARSIDLTLVLNAHATAQEALLSTSVIEPDSLVFVEGFMPAGDDDCPFGPDLRKLNGRRMYFGRDSTEYTVARNHLCGVIEKSLDDPIVQKRPYLVNALTEMRVLLALDCVVQYADRPSTATCGTSAETIALFSKYTGRSKRTNLLPPPAEIASTARAIQGMEHEIDAYEAAITAREVPAVETTLSVTGLIEKLDAHHDINRSASGEIKAYMSFGQAHAYSLEERFKEQNVQPEIMQLRDFFTSWYLDTPSQALRNRNRRIAHGALGSLIYAHYDSVIKTAADFEQLSEVIDTAYDHLEYVNGNDVALTHFLCRCIQARKAEATDPRDAKQQYLSIMRSIMPQPEQFVGTPIAVPGGETDEPLAA